MLRLGLCFRVRFGGLRLGVRAAVHEYSRKDFSEGMDRNLLQRHLLGDLEEVYS